MSASDDFSRLLGNGVKRGEAATQAVILDLFRKRDAQRLDLEALTRAARAHLDHPELASARETLLGFVQRMERQFSAIEAPDA